MSARHSTTLRGPRRSQTLASSAVCSPADVIWSGAVEALLAGKPALRRVRVAQEMRLEDDDVQFAALGRRHPQIEFSLPVRSSHCWHANSTW